MRDALRPKQELIHEVTGLRKQIVDLKDAMTARRRVEDALRQAETLLRTLTDNAPVGLCLFRRDGALLTANRPFARMLGYDSPAELQRVGAVLGVFASREEQIRMLSTSCCSPGSAGFRHKSGSLSLLDVVTAGCEGQDATVLVISQHPAASQPSSVPGA
jgi:PAS domain S-box-containing protein